jgi:hypothetical protein
MSILLLLVLAAIIGTAIWVRRSRSTGEWDAGPGAAAPDRRISLLAEAVGYLGTILLLAGASAAIGERWEDISTEWRLVILAITTLLFLAVGVLSRSSSEPAFRRLTGVVWALSVAGFAGGAAEVSEYFDAPARTAFLAIAVPSTAYAAALWMLHRHAIQQAVLFGGVLLSAAAVVVRAVDEPKSWMVAVPLWAMGLAWAAAGWWRQIEPWFVAVPLGLSVALIAPAAIAETSGLRFGLGLATGGAVMAMSVLAAFTPGLAMGAVAVLGYAIGAVTYYFGDTLGVPASLTITGLLVLTLAAAATRSHWFGRTRPPVSRPRATGPDAPGPADYRHRHV